MQIYEATFGFGYFIQHVGTPRDVAAINLSQNI